MAQQSVVHPHLNLLALPPDKTKTIWVIFCPRVSESPSQSLHHNGVLASSARSLARRLVMIDAMAALTELAALSADGGSMRPSASYHTRILLQDGEDWGFAISCVKHVAHFAMRAARCALPPRSRRGPCRRR